MFLNIRIDLILWKTYDQQFTLTTKKPLHIIFKETDTDFLPARYHRCHPTSSVMTLKELVSTAATPGKSPTGVIPSLSSRWLLRHGTSNSDDLLPTLDRQMATGWHLFQNKLGKPAPERLNQCRLWWSKRWWSGSGIGWTICRSFVPCSRQITTPAPHNWYCTVDAIE